MYANWYNQCVFLIKRLGAREFDNKRLFKSKSIEVDMKFVLQISYPLQMVQVRVIVKAPKSSSQQPQHSSICHWQGPCQVRDKEHRSICQLG